jgi:hypothetical protein
MMFEKFESTWFPLSPSGGNMSFENLDTLANALKEIALECVSKGPGYAQQGVVLRQARQDLRPANLLEERMILRAWHHLFEAGILEWGHDLDNPGSPFFHATTHQAIPAGVK